MNISSFVVRSVLAGLIFFLIACGEKKEDQGILSQQEMVRVLSEIYVVEDKINRMSITPDSSQVVFNIMLKKISEKTGVSDTLVRKSLDYYTKHPKEMAQIYTAVVDSLNLKEQRSQ